MSSLPDSVVTAAVLHVLSTQCRVRNETGLSCLVTRHLTMQHRQLATHCIIRDTTLQGQISLGVQRADLEPVLSCAEHT